MDVDSGTDDTVTELIQFFCGLCDHLAVFGRIGKKVSALTVLDIIDLSIGNNYWSRIIAKESNNTICLQYF